MAFRHLRVKLEQPEILLTPAVNCHGGTETPRLS